MALKNLCKLKWNIFILLYFMFDHSYYNSLS